MLVSTAKWFLDRFSISVDVVDGVLKLVVKFTGVTLFSYDLDIDKIVDVMDPNKSVTSYKVK